MSFGMGCPRNIKTNRSQHPGSFVDMVKIFDGMLTGITFTFCFNFLQQVPSQDTAADAKKF